MSWQSQRECLTIQHTHSHSQESRIITRKGIESNAILCGTKGAGIVNLRGGIVFSKELCDDTDLSRSTCHKAAVNSAYFKATASASDATTLLPDIPILFTQSLSRLVLYLQVIMSSPPPDSYNFFGFTPNLAFNASFLAIFGALTVLHTVLTVLQRRRDPLDGHIVTHGSWWRRHHVLGWGWITVVGGIGEIIGWAGRLWGHFDDTSLNAYLINQVCLAISPVFFSASCYVAFGLLIQILGPQYSRLKPRLYVIVFVVIDVLSLILQGIGGGMSGAAAGGDSGANLQTGRDIYLAGISFQLFNMLVFAYLVVEYLVRLHRAGGLFHHVAKPNGGSAAGQATPTTITIDTVRERRAIKLIVLGLAITTTMIVMRNFYRDVELGEGFDGFLATRENYFLLDAIPMVIAMIALA